VLCALEHCIQADTLATADGTGDARKISRDYRWPTGDPILPRGLLDLSDLARHVHPSDMKHHGTHGLIGLQRLVAIYLEAYLVGLAVD
jgi:hypothetical protein